MHMVYSIPSEVRRDPLLPFGQEAGDLQVTADNSGPLSKPDSLRCPFYGADEDTFYVNSYFIQ